MFLNHFYENRYANNLFSEKRKSKHYAHNRFFVKTGLATFFKNIKSGHFINVQLSKNFLESQIRESENLRFSEPLPFTVWGVYILCFFYIYRLYNEPV